MSKKVMLKVSCALLVLILVSGLGFWSLPPLQQTGGNLLVVIASVLSGPIMGTISILTNEGLGNSFEVLVLVFVICASGILWYLTRRTFWSFLIASLSWAMAGLLLTVGIYI